jgi:hypothetical protein
MHLAEFVGRLGGLAIQDEVDVTLAVQADILAAVAGHFDKTQRQEQLAQIGNAFGGGGGVLDKLKPSVASGLCSVLPFSFSLLFPYHSPVAAHGSKPDSQTCVVVASKDRTNAVAASKDKSENEEPQLPHTGCGIGTGTHVQAYRIRSVLRSGVETASFPAARFCVSHRASPLSLPTLSSDLLPPCKMSGLGFLF